MKKFFLGSLMALMTFFISCEKAPPPPVAYGPVPSERQMNWQEMEYYAFIHFSMNTFTDIEWGYGDKDPALFNPTELDTRQWARVIKEAGMKGVIVTAKHHDGFCLWPSEYTDYSVKNSPWKNGKGDLLKELSQACKEYGLKFGVYLSPWDRNHPDYGKPEYITYFRNQLKELLTNYGDVFEVWFDGANGGSGYYGGANENRSVDRKTYYDWENTYKIVRELQPNAMLFSDAGPDTRWCGTEEGWVGETNWSTLNRDEVWPGFPDYQELRYGHEDGTHWVPAEVDVSIRPGWFYHQSEDHKVKTLPEMLDIYYNSVGRNATLLLNFPVDPRGLIHETDVERVMELAKSLEADFKENLAKRAQVTASQVRGNAKKYNADNLTDGDKDTYWATDDAVTNATVTLDFGEPTEFNRFLVQEYIPLGQRVQEFSVEALIDGSWKELAKATTIGYKRILRLPTVKATKLRVHIKQAKACPVISNIEVYRAPKVYAKPDITRNKQGMVTIESADKELELYYTTDGTRPDVNSIRFEAPFELLGKANVKAIAIDPISGKKSPVSSENFDVARKKWQLVNIDDENAQSVLDGLEMTSWGQSSEKMPIDLVIDLGEDLKLKGFKYLPDQHRWSSGIIFDYEFYTSSNGNNWELQSKGEFSNIKNSPIWQTKNFKSVKARYIKLRALRNTEGNNKAGYAELTVITE
ncbi:alpha-L-fucosidase [Arenibacter nanhaiticus]|uniref:alpha-L-fucosidase n=1 Tax=Arenibacter nanhaiticus TaxID=558155 RepID=A0A1M6C8F7_9FLAO|nr:alpha-L-fucosidase [Arenibacter nanhaiticus]SHI57038.1 alpha-L-fucosidase [Arenibacter nanhaiticus]